MSAPKMTAKDVFRLLAALLLAPLLKAAPLCGSWLTRRAGWNCQRLADNYELYHNSSNGTMQLGLDVWPTAVNELTQIDWIGIGISEAGGMPGADIAVLVRNRTDPRGWSVWDMFAEDFVRPVMDTRQDKVLVAVQERSSDGRILACISFPMVSCDTTQDRPIRPGLHSYVIFAFGEGVFSYHGSRNRGDATVLLAPSNVSSKSNNTSGGNVTSTNSTASTPNSTSPNSTQPSNATLPATPPATPATPEERSTVSVLMPSITIPTDDTDPYICSDFELPGSLDRPYHVIDFTTLINTTAGPGQDRYVHHIVLYNCTTRPATFGRGPYECPGTPVNCSTFVLVATMANNTVTLPPEAGFRIGVGAMRYVVLQVHYNNVNLDSGLIDRSGFRLTYTSRLRKHDMGVITLGMTAFQIPARSRWSTGPNVCPPGCTRRLRQPVTLVSNLLHMHELGVGMSTQHLRQVTTANGTAQWVELEPTGLRQYYSFGYQPYTDVPPQTSVLMPGDALVTTCNYSNPHSYPVSYGTRTAEEMCYTFLAYYPLSELTYCTEVPGLRSSGVALCEGVEDGPLLDQLYRINSLSPAAQGRLVDTLMERSILVPREESMLTLARPFKPTLPNTCPKKT